MLEQKTKKSTKRWRFLKTFDIYAKPITMTYRGKEKFRSTFGGVVSIMILGFIIAIFSYKLRDMINRSQAQVKKNTLIKASNAYTPPENLVSRNITIAF
jgi:hypothetical protein